jgi:hypothetical protein
VGFPGESQTEFPGVSVQFENSQRCIAFFRAALEPQVERLGIGGFVELHLPGVHRAHVHAFEPVAADDDLRSAGWIFLPVYLKRDDVPRALQFLGIRLHTF